MVEVQIRELVTAVQSAQAQLTASEAARTTLQAQVDRMGRASGERKIGVDGTSGGLLSSMAQTVHGGIGQLSFAVTLPWCIQH